MCAGNLPRGRLLKPLDGHVFIGLHSVAITVAQAKIVLS
jgi:hypothetical protein